MLGYGQGRLVWAGGIGPTRSGQARTVVLVVNNQARLTSDLSGLEDCGPGMEPVVGLLLPTYYDDNDYYQHFGFESVIEWWEGEIDALGFNTSDSEIGRLTFY